MCTIKGICFEYNALSIYGSSTIGSMLALGTSGYKFESCLLY